VGNQQISPNGGGDDDNEFANAAIKYKTHSEKKRNCKIEVRFISVAVISPFHPPLSVQTTVIW
jgi:hypothetical protein